MANKNPNKENLKPFKKGESGNPKYCQVIIDRMLKLDPTLEIKRNGKREEFKAL